MRTESRRQMESKRTEAYVAGFNAGKSAPSQTCSPSMNQRSDWMHSWKLYMAGWNAGQRVN